MQQSTVRSAIGLYVSARHASYIFPLCYALQLVVAIADSPEDMEAATVSLRSSTLTTHFDLFVSPTPPDRLSLPCMRRGGPITAENPNPTCGR